MKRLIVMLGLLIPAVGYAQAPSPDVAEAVDKASTEGSSVSAMLTVRVSDRKASAAKALALAEARGGWFSNLSESQVDLRVPTEDVDDVVEQLRELGDVVERTYSRQDHSSEIAELTARIKGREDILAKYMDVLATARAKSVVAVEREISGAIQELERLKGRRRFLEARLAHAQVQVRFRFRDRSAPKRDGSSSFAWLNSMNMVTILSDFESGVDRSPSLVSVPVPDGFAPFRKAARFRAVSPDDVVYRVRNAKNRPRADLGFWKEALRTRMTEAGYRVLTDKTLADDKGYILEMGAANGERDQTYVIGLWVRGNRLVLAEATGEAEAFKARRGALMASLEAIEL